MREGNDVVRWHVNANSGTKLRREGGTRTILTIWQKILYNLAK